MAVLFIGMYWASALFMAFLQYKLNFGVKNIVLENTIPAEHVQAPEIKALLRSFLKRLLLATVVFGILLFGILWIRLDSFTMLLFFTSLFGMIIAQFIINIKAIEEMHELKIEKNWQTGTQKTLVDIKAVKEKNRKLFPLWWFVFPLLAFLILFSWQTAAQGIDVGTLMNGGMFFAMLILSLWMYYMVEKIPVKALTKDHATNQKVNDIQKSFYGRMVLALLIFSVIMSGAMVQVDTSGNATKNLLATIVILSVTIFMIGYSTFIVFGYRAETNHALSKVQPVYYENEDEFWRYGIYMNPNDPRLFVPARTSTNISLNLGLKKGKILAGIFGGLLVITCIFTIGMLGYNDFVSHPFQANVENRNIVLRHGFSSQTLPIDEVTSIQLVETATIDNAQRINGTATQNYWTGRFRLNNEEIRLLIFRKETKVVYIRTTSGAYYINDRTHGDTVAMYLRLLDTVKR